jgi:hypothetical protein
VIEMDAVPPAAPSDGIGPGAFSSPYWQNSGARASRERFVLRRVFTAGAVRKGFRMPKAAEPNEKEFTKRRSVEAGLQLADAAHVATWRLYCEVLGLWRGCRVKECRRHRRCLGQPAPCLMRALPGVPQARQLDAAKAVIAGGPRRVPPATHLEWNVRREPLPRLLTWGMQAEQ